MTQARAKEYTIDAMISEYIADTFEVQHIADVKISEYKIETQKAQYNCSHHSTVACEASTIRSGFCEIDAKSSEEAIDTILQSKP